MQPGKRETVAGRVSPSLLLQGALAGCLVLLALIWSSRGPEQANQAQQYVRELSLNVDVGGLPQQDQADVWCEARPPPSFPPTANQLRQLRVAIIVDPVCRRQENYHPDKMKACLDKIVSHCQDLTKNGCFGGWSSKTPECEGMLPAETLPDGSAPSIKWSHYQNWWQTVMTLIAPELRSMGWDNLKILSDSGSASERRMASCADVLVISTITFWQLYPFKHVMRPHQKVVLIEQYGAGTFMIPQDLETGVESDRTLAVVKHVLVDPPERQNGPYLEERSHLALMVPAIEGGEAYVTNRERPWTSSTLDKMEALLPMTVRFANPLQCGGSWSFIRYHGFFTKDHNRWPMPPLSKRPYDVTFIGKLEYEAKAEVSGVTAHRMAAVKALSAFRDKWGQQYKVYVPQGERLEYHDYIGLLKQSKIVVSPWGWGEWSHKDFEILMSGCVVVKPRVDIFKLHPPIFKHNATAISVREDFSDLEEQIMPYLTDIPRAQAMATRAQGVFRKYSRPEVIAADWDDLLQRRLTEAFSKAPAQEWQPRSELEVDAAAAAEEEEGRQRLERNDGAAEEEERKEEEHKAEAEAEAEAAAEEEQEPEEEEVSEQQQEEQEASKGQAQQREQDGQEEEEEVGEEEAVTEQQQQQEKEPGQHGKAVGRKGGAADEAATDTERR